MSYATSLDTAEAGTQAILADFENAKKRHRVSESSRPFVLVTWAQSADGYIAAAPGRQTFISCEETGQLTHELRSRCDAIMVGSGTVATDNPRLNTRLRNQPASGRPVAVVLDRLANVRPDAAIISARAGENVPVLLYSGSEAMQSDRVLENMPKNVSRVGVPVEAVADHSGCPAREGPYLDLHSTMEDMKDRGIQSVMIEGGSRVINSFLSDEALLDYVIVTIAPKLLGSGVLGVKGHRSKLPAQLTETAFEQVGLDCVLRGRVLHSETKHDA